MFLTSASSLKWVLVLLVACHDNPRKICEVRRLEQYPSKAACELAAHQRKDWLDTACVGLLPSRIVFKQKRKSGS